MKISALALLLCAATACGTPALGETPAAAAATAPKPNDYADAANWLCRPGRADACAADETSTTVRADGSESVES